MPTPDPWPGESLEYYEAYDGADNDLYGDLYYRDSGGRTLESGDVWRIWYRSDWQVSNRYLDDPDEAAVVSWVIEVTAGSGTLVASEGIDPDYGDPDATAPVPVGTFTIAGAGTYVIPSVLMDAAYIVEGDDTCLVRLECTSGSIDVQQAKIRVWPVGGPLGAWSDVQPGFTPAVDFTPSALRNTASEAGTADDGSPSDAWDGAATAVLAAAPDGIFTNVGTDQSDIAASILALGGSQWRGSVSRTETVVVFTGADWTTGHPIDTDTLTEGVDYVRPPTEIAGEAPAYAAQQIGSGGTSWLGTTGSATVYAQSDLTDLVPVLHSQTDDDLTLTPLGGGLVGITGATYTAGSAVATPHPSSDQTVPATLSTGAGRYLIVSLGYAGNWPVWPGWAPAITGSSIAQDSLFTVTFPDLVSRRVMPPYRVWDPAATVAARIPLQWNQRPDQLGLEGAALWRADLTGHHRAQWRGTI